MHTSKTGYNKTVCIARQCVEQVSVYNVYKRMYKREQENKAIV